MCGPSRSLFTTNDHVSHLSPTPKTTSKILAVILMVACGLFFAGIASGLPEAVQADEGFEINRALKLGAGVFDFERTTKGGLFYILFVEYGFYFAWLWLTGSITSPEDFVASFVEDPSPFWIMGRATVALLSMVLVFLSYRLGASLYGRRVGLIGAAATTVTVLVVRMAHHVNVDVMMSVAVLWSILLAFDWADPAKKPRPILLGVVFALSVMAKATAAVAIVPIVVANVLRYRKTSWKSALCGRELVLSLSVAAIVYVCGNPGIIVNASDVVRKARLVVLGSSEAIGTTEQAMHAETSRIDKNLGVFYSRVLAKSFGLPFFCLTVCGLLFACIRRGRADILMLSFLLTFFLLIVGVQSKNYAYPRYVLVATPLLAVLGARVLVTTFDRVPWIRKRSGLVAAVAAAVLLTPTSWTTAKWSYIHLRGDTRVIAHDWIEANVPKGSTVLVEGNPIVETSLAVPLRNTAVNIDQLIATMPDSESPKARFLAMRKDATRGVPYDLRGFRHFEPVKSLGEYKEDGVRFFVLTKESFDPGYVEPGQWREDIWRTRLELYRALTSDPHVTLIYDIDSAREQLSGPSIVVFHLSAPEDQPLLVERR